MFGLRRLIRWALFKACDFKEGTVFVQCVTDDATIETEIISPLGLYAMPKKDDCLIIFNTDDNPSNSFALAVNKKQIDQDSGDILFTNDSGSYIRIRENGDIDIRSIGKLNILSKDDIMLDTGQKISLGNKATKGVARQTDAVSQTNITGGSKKVFCED